MSVILLRVSKMEHSCKHQDMCTVQFLMEVAVKSNTKRQLVVEFQMQQWCIVTLSLPRPCLWPPERVSARSPPASTWECSDSAPIFLNISLLYSSWECPHSAPIFHNISFLYSARATNLSHSINAILILLSIDKSVQVPFLSQLILSIFIVTYFTNKKYFRHENIPIQHNHDLRQLCTLTHLHILILLLSISIFCFHSHRSIWSCPAYDFNFLSSRQPY